MKKELIFCLVYLSMSLTQLIGQGTISQNIYFASDEYVLDEPAKTTIAEFIAQLQEYSEFKITIEGHTDQDGSNSYNLDLSQKRAEAVKHALEDLGLDQSEIKADFKGEEQLAAQGIDDSSKKKNRRVQLTAHTYNYENTKELINLLNEENETTVSIDPRKEETIKLTLGTEIKIPAHAFCYEDGSSVDASKIVIETKEAFSYLDMIDNNLFTMTKDAMLETGGMIFIEASAEGQKLQLKEGQSIDITYPAQKPLKNMSLFTGVSSDDNDLNDGVIWEATNQEIETIAEEEESYFVQVDLSAIFDYEFVDSGKPTLEFDEMPRFPRPVREAFPPSKRLYDDEKYEEVYQKYVEANKLYEKDQETYDERLDNWKREVKARKQEIRKHYSDLKYYYTERRIQTAIKILEKKYQNESHDLIINKMFGFLDQKIPRIPFDEKYAIKKAFGNQTKNAKEQVGLNIFPNNLLAYDRSSTYAKSFYQIIENVERDIMQEKYRQGYVDNALVQKYVFSSSKLGWINCDRFYNVSPTQLTDLIIANTQKEEEHFLVFEDIKSVMGPNRYNGVAFKNIPKNKKATVIGFKVINNQAYIASQEVVIGSIKKLELKYEKTNLDHLKNTCLLYTSPSPRDQRGSRMPSSA